MGDRAFIASRRDVTTRAARAVLHMANAMAVSLNITWADETDEKLTGASHSATAYGETSAGRPIQSLPGNLGSVVAITHLEQSVRELQAQIDELRKAASEHAPNNGQQPAPPDQIITEPAPAPEDTSVLEEAPEPPKGDDDA